jgi:hypothetical protein
MGVMVDGVWHEEIADPNPGGGSNLSSSSPWVSGGYNAGAGAWQPSSAGGSSGGSSGGGGQQQQQNMGGGIDAILQALQAGDQRSFDELVRQFNQEFGVKEAGVTGTYQGAPTLPALTSYATQFGQWGVPTAGQQTLPAQQQQYEQQMGAINAAAALQANPFRQAQVIGQLGGLLGGRGVAGFQAPGQAQGQTDFSGMGNLQRLIDDIRGGPGAINSQSTQGVLDAIPTPTKLNSVEFARASPLTQNLVLQGMQEKYGLSPDDSLAQIKNTLPQFQAPTTMGTLKR